MGQITDSAWIQTVRGLIPAQDLGFCHAHEHLFTSHDHAARIDPALLLDSYECTLAELELFKRAGGRGVVDAQPVGCGRRADLLQRASEASGVHVIASTGFHKLIYYPGDHWLHTASEEVLCELFLTELTEGMFLDGDHAFPRQKSSIRAGVIKAASDSAGITPEYLRLFTAAGLAAKQTGVSVRSRQATLDRRARRQADGGFGPDPHGKGCGGFGAGGTASRFGPRSRVHHCKPP